MNFDRRVEMVSFELGEELRNLWLSGRASERKSKGLRFDSSWGLRIFSLSHAPDKTKKHLSYIMNVSFLHTGYMHNLILETC